MKTKLLVILTITMVSLLTISYSYACVTNGALPVNYASFGIEFTAVTVKDNQYILHVAHVQAQITPDHETIDTAITNGYSGYEAYITYTIKNVGSFPVTFDKVSIENYNPEALNVTNTKLADVVLQPSQTTQGTTTVQVLQGAKQHQQYTFQVQITATGEKTHPRSIDFWEDQFEACLQKNGAPEIGPATLQAYLNQITSQSQIFQFSGTQTQEFQQALSTLNPKKLSEENNLKAQLLTLWLNLAAGWTDGYKVNGMTAQQIIQGAENALLKSQTTKYEYWEDQCEAFSDIC
jgi:hypothetical protein